MPSRVAVAITAPFATSLAAALFAAAEALAVPAAANGNAATDAAVFAAALAALQSRHIEPQRPGERMVAGLRGLRSADPALEVTASRGRLEVRIGSGAPFALTLSPDADATSWGRAGAQAVAAATAASQRLGALDPERRRGLVLAELAAGLDPYTRHVPAREAEALRAARMGTGSLGLTLQPEAGGARVARLEPEGPAWRAGLALGDRVVEIDGVTTRGLDPEALAKALAGEPGTPVVLSVSRHGGAPRRLVIVRAATVAQTARLAWTAEVPVIAVTAFSRDTDQAVARLVSGLAARTPRPQALILDLRGNRGGLLPQAVGVADVFLAGGEVVHQRGRHPEASRTWLAGGADLAEGMQVVVLVDGGTASAAEAVAASLQDLGRAWIVGSATRGKGLIQLVRPLPDGSELHISWSRLLRRDGQPLQDRGVVPHLCTSRGDGLARAAASRLLAATGPDRAPFSALAEALGDRESCPPAEGSALDIHAALWLLRPRAAAALEAGDSHLR